MVALISLLVPVFSTSSGYAQSAASALWTTHTLDSRVLGETRILRISIPPGHDLPQQAANNYAVLIVLDAESPDNFTTVVANARNLGGVAAIPPMIIVGVENLSGATRWRDMTFPSAAGKPVRVDGGGGAMRFLEFLRSEVRPYVDSRYRTAPLTVIHGHSEGGSFGRWAFGQAPEFINAVIASSPTPHEPDRVLDLIAARGRPGRLIMFSGMEEGLDRSAQSFAAALRERNIAGLVFEHQRIPDAAHFATAPLGIVPGLRFIFRPVSLAGYQVEFDDTNDGPRMLAKFTAEFDSARAAYLRGAAELGLRERLPFGFLYSQLRWYQNETTAPLRLRICQEMIVTAPNVWHGFECAGEALMRMGRSAEGVAHYRRALEAARIVGDRAAVDRLSKRAASGSD